MSSDEKVVLEITTKELTGYLDNGTTYRYWTFDGTVPGPLLRDERPSFVVFNGKAAGLTGDNAMKARVGERIRLFVGNGGPNLTSSFHVIGEIFDRAYPEGATEAQSNVQTTLIPAGGAAWVEFTIDVPGAYTLVDHALSRAIDKGAVAQIIAEGAANPAIFDVPAGQELSSH